jgi:FtsP/CotA-like multicopper oxidase with cupredoxin domain
MSLQSVTLVVACGRRIMHVLKKGRMLVGAVTMLCLLLATDAHAAPNPQTPLAASNIPQFTQALPLLSVQPGGTMSTVVATNTSFTNPLPIRMCEFKTQVLPPPLPPTWTWGYIVGTSCPTEGEVKDTYIGPVLVNLKDVPTTIKYTNALRTTATTNVLAYKFSTDQTLHWADPLGIAGLSFPEDNYCHMQSFDMTDPADPPAPGVGIPGFGTPCSLNFGEDPTKPGTFLAKGIPAVPHLHGGEVPPVLDGGPDAWFTSFNGDGVTVEQGHDYYTNPLVPVAPNEAVYSYPNTQGQAPLWFHDHTLGATRLNVYAGIAGAYYLLDPAQEDLDPNTLDWFQQIKMRSVTEIVPIVLQDRMFDTNGQFYFPVDFPGGINGPPPNPQHPYWNPEFIGDTIVVNGKAWPFLKVEPRRYRFLFLNGSNARTYELFFTNPKTKVNGPVMWTIGDDGGILDKPSIIDPNAAKPVEQHLIIMPGERYEIIVDFSKVAGQTLILKNTAKAPFPGGATPMGSTTARIMQFIVSGTAVADNSYDPASGIPLRPTPIVRLTDPTKGTLWPGVTPNKVRVLTLNEVAIDFPQTTIDPITGQTQTYPGGPFEVLVNNTPWSGQTPRTYNDFTKVTIVNPLTKTPVTELVSETPKEGDIELWEIVNTTADAHPIHTHLTTFQILNRQNYSASMFDPDYAAAFPGVTGSTACPAGVYCPGFGPPLPYDSGVTRLINNVQVPVVGGNLEMAKYLANAVLLPDPDEVGWKDTFLVYPGMVNRIVVRYAPTATALGTVGSYPFSPNDGTNGSLSDSHTYVWHCHIIDHEDNEMMRQTVVEPLNVGRTYVKGVNY